MLSTGADPTCSSGLRVLPLITLLCAHADAAARELVDLSIEELSQVKVTSVSRRAEPLNVLASAVQVITAEDIRRSGATRIPEALRLASNLQVAQVNGNAWAISARGFNTALANKLLVMIDGRTVYSPLFAGTYWETIDLPLFDIDRIEVISGPGGVLWGANAVNGVINIITKSAADTQSLAARAGAGEEVRGLGALRYGGAIGESAHYRVYGKYTDRDGVQLANGGDARNDSSFGQAGFRIDAHPSMRDAITLQGDFNETHTEQATNDDVIGRARNVLARWTRTLSEGSLQLQTYYDYAYHENPGFYSDTLETLDIEVQHDFALSPRQHLIWGATYRRIQDHFENGVYRMDPASASLERVGGFIKDQIAVAPDKLYLTVGTKFEDNEYTGAEWQPSASLSWRYEPGRLLWTRISRAVRTPSRFDRAIANPLSPIFTIGSDEFDSETLIAYEAGWKTQLPAGVQLSVAVYHNEYDELRSFERLAPSAPIPFVVSNRLEGESNGLELTAAYQLAPAARLWFGYSYLDLDLEPEPTSTDPTRGAVEARDWEHQAFLRAAVDLSEDWECNAELRRIEGVDSHRLPGYTELDLRVAWRIAPAFELAVLGRNLLNPTHGEFGPPGRMQIERAGYLQLTWTP